MRRNVLLQFENGLAGVNLEWDLLVPAAWRAYIDLYLLCSAAAVFCHGVDELEVSVVFFDGVGERESSKVGTR